MSSQRLQPSSSRKRSAVVAGILTKYANMAKGWRDRLFVMSDGKLMYFKLSGHSRASVHEVLDHYDPEGSNTRLIGAKIFLLQRDTGKNEKRAKKAVSDLIVATYELNRAKLRQSGTESHKFYVNLGGQPMLTLKTETPDDRAAWMAALTHSKASSAEAALAGLDISRRNSFCPQSLPSFGELDKVETAAGELLSSLRQEHGASEAACAAVNSHLQMLQNKLKDVMMQAKSREQTVSQLLDEKRQLETRVVAVSGNLPDDLDRHTSSSHIGGEDQSGNGDSDMQSLGSSAFAGDDNGMDEGEECDGEVFYDVRTLMPSARSRSASSSLPDASNDARSAVNGKSGGLAKSTRAEDPAWLVDEPAPKRRLYLPEPEEVQKSVSLWSIIKEAIGKDLTRICLPVYFNEPLSALQKMAEEFEYSYLLDSAAQAPKGSVERLTCVAAFAVSGYAGTVGRTCKPFNPLLGETFELVDKERSMRFVAEKVVHHPTVVVAHCEGRQWVVDGDMEVKSKFWGRCIELKPVGCIQAKFDDGEVVTWNKVTSSINNLILGKIYIEHAGVARLSTDCSSNELRVRFKDGGWTTSKRDISGHLYRSGKEVSNYRLTGTWDSSVVVEVEGQEPRVLWSASPPAKDPTRYNLSQFAIQLNELTPGLQEKLPPTDCRLRPDQAALERGRFDEANAEKQRLEKKQRRARKEAEEGKPLKPRWFAPVKGARRGDAITFQFTGEYWNARGAGKYTECRDIFAADSEP